MRREGELWEWSRRFPPALARAYEQATGEPPADPSDARHMVSTILNAEFPPRA